MLTTCGDTNIKHHNNGVDPALCLYVGAYLVFLNNSFLRENISHGNDILCCLVSMKLKHNAYTCSKNYYCKKVWNVRANDIEWIECDNVIKTNAIHKLEKRSMTYRAKKSHPMRAYLIISMKKLNVCRTSCLNFANQGG